MPTGPAGRIRRDRPFTIGCGARPGPRGSLVGSQAMPAYLDTIVAAHRAAGRRGPAATSTPPSNRPRRAGPVPPVRRGHRPRRPTGRVAVIAEIKRRSPSKGDLDPSLDPAAVAADYQAGGAACLSVLTDRDFFGGSARRPARGPGRRARFRSCARTSPSSALDVCDARTMGADAVLLIVAALDRRRARPPSWPWPAGVGWTRWSRSTTSSSSKRALGAGADLIGVNQRDLHTFEVDHGGPWGWAAPIPPDGDGGGRVGDPGRRRRRRLADAGYRAVLVGETWSARTTGGPRWPSCSGSGR